MAAIQASSKIVVARDWSALDDEVALRLAQAREGLKLSQSQFAYRLGITRAALMSYEDGRAPLKCYLGLKLCRQFFISEYWLATGFGTDEDERRGRRCPFPGIGVDRVAPRLTMALFAEKIALTIPQGISFAAGFHQYLKSEYFRLAKEQKGFPRIVTLPDGSPEYLCNAVECMLDFWTNGLAPLHHEDFFQGLIHSGNKLFEKMSEKD